MKYIARVKAAARIDEVTNEGNTLFIKTKAPAREGKANKAIIELLADYFKVSRNSIVIKSGLNSKNKIIEIENT
jgi:uncharacterized protein (TIGR00251 family)